MTQLAWEHREILVGYAIPIKKKRNQKNQPKNFNHRILGTASSGLQWLLQEQNSNFSSVFKQQFCKGWAERIL